MKARQAGRWDVSDASVSSALLIPQCKFALLSPLTCISTRTLITLLGGNLRLHMPSLLMSSLLSGYEYYVVLRERGN